MVFCGRHREWSIGAHTDHSNHHARPTADADDHGARCAREPTGFTRTRRCEHSVLLSAQLSCSHSRATANGEVHRSWCARVDRPARALDTSVARDTMDNRAAHTHVVTRAREVALKLKRSNRLHTLGTLPKLRLLEIDDADFSWRPGYFSRKALHRGFQETQSRSFYKIIVAITK